MSYIFFLTQWQVIVSNIYDRHFNSRVQIWPQIIGKKYATYMWTHKHDGREIQGVAIL